MKNNRGQVSLEFMLLIVFLLVFLVSTILPSVELAGNTAQEVEAIGQARIATQKIVDTIERLSYQSAGSQQTLTIFIPVDTNIYCEPINLTSNVLEDQNIGFSVRLKNTAIPPVRCQDDQDHYFNDPGTCTYSLQVRTPIPLNCNNLAPNSDESELLVIGGQTTNVLVRNNGSSIIVAATS